MDVFNLLNLNSNTREADLTSPTFLLRVPLAVETPRTVRLGMAGTFEFVNRIEPRKPPPRRQTSKGDPARRRVCLNRGKVVRAACSFFCLLVGFSILLSAQDLGDAPFERPSPSRLELRRSAFRRLDRRAGIGSQLYDGRIARSATSPSASSCSAAC